MGIPTVQSELELRNILLSTALTKPTANWIGLHSTAPINDADYGVELSGSGYERIEVSTWDFSARQAENSTVITFPTATGAWLEAVSFGVYTSSGSTAFIRGGALDTARTAASGDVLRFSTGAIVIQYNTSTDL